MKTLHIGGPNGKQKTKNTKKPSKNQTKQQQKMHENKFYEKHSFITLCLFNSRFEF